MKRNLMWLTFFFMGVISGCAQAASSDMTTITLKEYTINPEVVSLKNTEAPIEIRVKNGGMDDHNFVIDELGVDSGIIAPGESASVFIDKKESGTFEVKCTLPGHTEAGMVSEIRIGS